jgi:hypothetical protein
VRQQAQIDFEIVVALHVVALAAFFSWSLFFRCGVNLLAFSTDFPALALRRAVQSLPEERS